MLGEADRHGAERTELADVRCQLDELSERRRLYGFTPAEQLRYRELADIERLLLRL